MSLYETLEIKNTATASEIKKAYQKLSMLHHPDRGGDEDQFKRIAEAYEVLSDLDKRAEYDATGEIPTGSDKEHLDFIANAFLNLMKSRNFDKIDYTAIIIDEFKREVRKQKSTAKELESVLARMEWNITRHKFNSAYIESLLEERIEALASQIAVVKKSEKILIKSLEYLKNCKYEGPMELGKLYN